MRWKRMLQDIPQAIVYPVDTDIVKPSPLRWLFVAVVGVAVIFVAVLVIVFFVGGDVNRPGWAPQGCTVIIDEAFGNRVTILVHDIFDFDTEAECASVILAALGGETAFFSRRSTNPRGIQACIDIQFPRTSYGDQPVVQYYEVRTPNFNYNVLRSIGTPYTYENEDITGDELARVAGGDLELGFLEWLVLERAAD